MKTAEEWSLEMHSIGCQLPYPYKGYTTLTDHIKQIQLDAWKQGMSDAAEIADSKISSWGITLSITASKLRDCVHQKRDTTQSL